MPKLKIVFPEDAQLPYSYVNEKGAKIEGTQTVDFDHFLDLVDQNPLWFESVKAGMAQDAIRRSRDAAKAAGADHMWISDSDHIYLKRACEEPKTILAGSGQTILGLGGIMPQHARRLLPFQLAVINAKTEAEVAKEEEAAKAAKVSKPELVAG